jgi:hypothetical protein
MGLESLFEFRKQPLAIDCINGNRFIARGGDNALSLKSIKDPTCVWYEEEVPTEEDFATITLTIRATYATILQEWFTINPQVEGDYQDNWFWKRFFKDREGLSFRTKTQVELQDGEIVDSHVTVHHSTYNDNRWLSSQVKALIEGYKDTNEYLYSVYAKGLWTTKETGGNFYKHFQRSRHVQNVEYNPELPLHISIDFNVNPYMTCVIVQIVEKQIRCIDEICLPYPRNTSLAVCAEFKTRFRNHNAGLFVYGDPQGLKNYTAVNAVVRTKEEDYNEFAIILKELKEYRPVNRVPRSYPPVKLRGDFVNAIFNHCEQGVEIIVSEKCPKLIADFMYGKEASDGTKHKEKVKDSETGVTYEKYFHCFVGETMITTNNGCKRIDKIKKGDFVLTRNGYRKVLNLFDNGVKDVYTYSVYGITIKCTADHKVFTKNGFISISELIGSNTFCIFVKKIQWIKNLRFTTISCLQGILTQKTEQTQYILQGGLIAKRLGCILTSTKKKLGKFLKGIIYTTRTETQAITKSQTLNVCPQKNIQIDILQKKEDNCIQKYWKKKQDQKPQYGIVQRKGLNGIRNTLKQHLLQKKGTYSVRLAGQLKQLIQLLKYGGVLQDVKTELTQEGIEPIKRKVYDIEVENCHEYFANGILVHNCSDATDYLITSAFKTEMSIFDKGVKGVVFETIEQEKPLSRYF